MADGKARQRIPQAKAARWVYPPPRPLPALAPGILTFEVENREAFFAVDEGILVKTGTQVLVSVRNTIGGADLGKLRQAVDQEFLSLDERAKSVRTVLAKLESDFARRLLELSRHG